MFDIAFPLISVLYIKIILGNTDIGKGEVDYIRK